MSKVLLANQLFVPEDRITRDDLKRWYYEWKEDIWEDVVDENGELVLTKTGKPRVKKRTETRSFSTYEWAVDVEGRRWACVPRGNFEKVKALLRTNRKDVVDLRCDAPINLGIHMLPDTRKDPRWQAQRKAVQQWLQTGWGIIHGKPGSGKTVAGMYAIACTKQRTLIISKRTDGNFHWIKQFRDRTNLGEIEEAEGQEMIGSYKASKNQVWPITVVTVQSFIHDNGHKRLAELQQKFGLVLIDEVHEFGSPVYSQLLSCLNPMYILGVTATPTRKDKKHHLVYDLVGPVIATMEAKTMPPRVTFILTRIKSPEWLNKKPYPRRYKWRKCMEYLLGSERRYKIILAELLRDIKRGRTIATISERREIPTRLYEMLIAEGIEGVEYVDGTTKNKQREEIYERVRTGETQVLCAGKVLNALVDISNIDCVHLVSPINDKTNVEQIYGRGTRWMEGKLQPEVKDYADEGGQLSGAFRNRRKICAQAGWEVEIVDGALPLFWKK